VIKRPHVLCALASLLVIGTAISPAVGIPAALRNSSRTVTADGAESCRGGWKRCSRSDVSASTSTTTSTPTTTPSSTIATTAAPTTVASTVPVTSTAPPPAAGYFTLAAAGQWSALPSGAECKNRVHYSAWEPRPDNYKRNHTLVDPAAVASSFAARPFGSGWKNWDTLVRPRVNGQFAGTTDEIFQWAACKWGLPDNVLRALAVRESTWYQYETYSTGRCVVHFSCGDFPSAATSDSATYCNAVARFGYDYQADYSRGVCPKTFGITGVMSWQAPSWGAMTDNQNGAFPFNRNSTAFAVDYVASYLRGCFEGWISWLANTGLVGDYTAGDLWGCVGSWYAGDWKSPEANGYATRVHDELVNTPWLDPSWPTDKPGCDSAYGCPGPDNL
jgi:hypothetical protein